MTSSWSDAVASLLTNGNAAFEMDPLCPNILSKMAGKRYCITPISVRSLQVSKFLRLAVWFYGLLWNLTGVSAKMLSVNFQSDPSIINIKSSTRDAVLRYILSNTEVASWILTSLQWWHNERDGVSNHRRFDCLLNHLFRRRSKKTSKLRVTGLCEGNSPVTGEFPAHWANNAENVSIWLRHHHFSYWKKATHVIITVAPFTNMV